MIEVFARLAEAYRCPVYQIYGHRVAATLQTLLHPRTGENQLDHADLVLQSGPGFVCGQSIRRGLLLCTRRHGGQ